MQLSAKSQVGRVILASALALGAAGAASAAGPVAAFVRTGVIEHPELTEISGLVASRSRRGVFWAINDSGNAARLYAVDFKGSLLAKVNVSGVRNVDWEDLAWFEREGRAFLAIAETGDNFTWRTDVAVYIVAEPAPDANEAAVERELRFVYEDGPRDVEALAVDLQGDRLLLLSKDARDTGLYALPLSGDQTVARRIADFPRLWPQAPGAAIAPISAQRFRGAATAMDISADGRRLLVLTYTHVFVYEREPGEDWLLALTRPPQAYGIPRDEKGFEAACFDADDQSFWITHESASAKLYWHP